METVAETTSASFAAGQEPLTVLIVDDDHAIVEGLAEFLEGEGFDVVTAADGQDALDQLRRGVLPRAIVLDLMMPRMNGWEFRHEQLQDGDLKDIPIVVVSAVPPDAAARAKLGDVDYLPKPPSLPRLLAAVWRHCDDPHPVAASDRVSRHLPRTHTGRDVSVAVVGLLSKSAS